MSEHKPVLIIGFDTTKVVVGEPLHPMALDHHIIKIQLLANDELIDEKKLEPNEKPEAEFDTKNLSVGQLHSLKAKAVCNIHGEFES